jgi:hypothetical protein
MGGVTWANHFKALWENAKLSKSIDITPIIQVPALQLSSHVCLDTLDQLFSGLPDIRHEVSLEHKVSETGRQGDGERLTLLSHLRSSDSSHVDGSDSISAFFVQRVVEMWNTSFGIVLGRKNFTTPDRPRRNSCHYAGESEE